MAGVASRMAPPSNAASQRDCTSTNGMVNPLIVPALLASVKATSLLILGDPMKSLGSWLALLGAFDAIYWALCGLLYGRVVEE